MLFACACSEKAHRPLRSAATDNASQTSVTSTQRIRPTLTRRSPKLKVTVLVVKAMKPWTAKVKANDFVFFPVYNRS